MLQINQFNQTIGFALENWLPRKLPARISMQGKYCILEPLDIEKHAEKLFTALIHENSGTSWTYLPYGPFTNYVAFYHWLQSQKEDEVIFYTILDNSGKPLGLASYLNMQPKYGTIEVGHLHYSKQLQKTRIATEAMYLMMRHVFSDLGYRRYEWKCDSLNLDSRKAAERLGFKFEGIFRQHWVYKNRNRDTAWYSLLNREWPIIKNRLEAWLDPSNFTAAGEQRKKLAEIS